MPDRDFWRGRRVLVTGHTGFKGSWLSMWLLELQAEVSGLALAPSTTPAMFDLSRLDHRMHHTIGDVRDPSTTLAAIATSQPEIVFHLAAQGLVRRSLHDPVTTFATNVLGTAHLLEAIRHDGRVKAVVVVTSDKCYAPNPFTTGYTEADPLGGDDPYSASKACQEMVAHAYRHCYLPREVATVRAGNVIGGGDWADDRLIPDAVRALQARRELRVRNPTAVRPWQHVLDPLAGYLLVAEKLTAAQPVAGAWNFGPAPDDAVPVGEVVDRLHRAWGTGSWSHVADADAAREAPQLRLDASRARRELGWRPRLTLDMALTWSVEWYRGVIDEGRDPFALTQEQIKRYEGIVSA
jgi:CDP-glucose 4,6-dehydratase